MLLLMITFYHHIKTPVGFGVSRNWIANLLLDNKILY